MNLRNRVDALEQRIDPRDAGSPDCPACGAKGKWSVYLAVENDGTVATRCMRCSAPRPHPGGEIHVELRWLMEAI